ncbi:MAG: DUF308 domain-containing protein [Lachnospiraceae bacterium]
MNIFKAMKKNVIVTSSIYIIVGLILAIFPGSTARTIGYAFATVILIAGLGFLYRFIVKDCVYSFVGNELVVGIVLVLASVFVYARVEDVMSFIPLLLGILILVSGLSKLQNAIGLHRMQYRGSKVVLIMAILNILLGILLILNPFDAITTLIMLIGIGLILSGLTDIITSLWIAGNVAKSAKTDVIEAESRDIE